MTTNKKPSAEEPIDGIQILRDIHEEYKDDPTAKGFITSEAAMAFVGAYEQLQFELELEKQKVKMMEQNIDYADRNNALLHKLFKKAQNDLDAELIFNADERKRLQKFLVHKLVRASDAIVELCKIQSEM